MRFSNYHTHTTFCDGADSPEELVLEAIRLGCPEIGFSGHSHIPGHRWCMTEEGTRAYCAEVRRLQEKYADRITVRLGIEQDLLSTVDRSLYDYVIGAVHYVERDGKCFSVDASRESFLAAVQEVYAGDFYAFAEDYYALVATLPERMDCCIIAHFDLITKFNEGNALFDTEHPRYRAAADRALDRLAESDVLLEVNTGAIARGYRTTPYPEPCLIDRWLARGRELILSSDCHDRRFLLCEFDKLQTLPHREMLC